MILGPHTIEVLRAPQVAGDYGNATTADWDNAETHDVAGCSVQPAPAPEFTENRDTFLSRWQVFAPADADVLATDRVVWSGHTYEVDGDVLRWDYPPLSHLVINLHRSEDT